MRGEPEENLREEISKIYDCGIRAICIEARPHDDFCGPGWWHDVDIVLDEARKRDMKIWILDDKHFPTGYAAGLIETKYPERNKWYLNETIVDIYGSQNPKTIRIDRMLKPSIGFWQIGDVFAHPEKIGLRAQNQMYAVVATKFVGSDSFSEEDVVDLTDQVKDGLCSFTLPEGQWRVHVMYKTQTDGGNEHYINMIDKVSAGTQIEGVYESHYERYGDEFGKTIAGFFSDEPAIGNISLPDYYARVGKKGMPLPWSDELEQMLIERYGDKLHTVMPYLFAESDVMKICPQVRYDFMDCVSYLYQENFSKPIGEWCRAHGVEYIGHVVEDNGAHSRLGIGPSHFFRAMTGQDMAGIDIIGAQYYFGAPDTMRRSMGPLETNGEFYHYILGKMGASSGHLDPLKKGRTMCELFGAYGWGFGVRDMKYLLDHTLSRGVNHLVPHAFSMAEYPDQDCPPHFNARGNNLQISWFGDLMRYANRMCDVLNGGKHRASVAVLYDGEGDWTAVHLPMEKVGKELTRGQVEFDVVPLDVLDDLSVWDGRCENGVMTINGIEFRILLVPYMKYVPEKLLRFMEKYPEFPVWFVGGAPDSLIRNSAGELADAAALQEVLAGAKVMEVEGLASRLAELGLREVTLEPAFADIAVYQYEKERRIYMLVNEHPDKAFHGQVKLPGIEPYMFYDGMDDVYKAASGEISAGYNSIYLDLEPGESCVLMEMKNTECAGPHTSFKHQIMQCLTAKDISDNWEVSWAKPMEYPQFEENVHMEKLVPVSDTAPKFSGIMRYEKTVDLDQVPESAFFKAEYVFEVMRLYVNGELAGSRLTPPYQIDVSKYLKKGENQIVIEVANTPARDQLNYPEPPFDFKHDALEPSGMFGKITLYMK